MDARSYSGRAWLISLLLGCALVLGAGTARADVPEDVVPDGATPAPAPQPPAAPEPLPVPEPLSTPEPAESPETKDPSVDIRALVYTYAPEATPWLRRADEPDAPPAAPPPAASDGSAPPPETAPAPAHTTAPARGQEAKADPPPHTTASTPDPEATTAPPEATTADPERPGLRTGHPRGAPVERGAPEHGGVKARPKGDQLLAEAESRLRRVETELGRIRQLLDAGERPSEPALTALSHSLEQLAPAVGALARHMTEHPAGSADLAALERRLGRARAVAADLLVALTRHGVSSPESVRLDAALERLALAASRLTPGRGAGAVERPSQSVAQPPQPAYTQSAVDAAQAESGIAGASRERAVSRAESPDAPPSGPQPQSPAPGGGAQASGGSTTFLTGGPAVLALLLALALPRLPRQLARIPARRQPAWFARPLERPG